MKRHLLLCIALVLVFAAKARSEVPPLQSVQLAWDYTNAPADGFLTFRLYSKVGVVTNFVAASTNLNLLLTNVIAGSHYWFVTASNIWGESDPSAPLVTPSVPKPPTNLRPVSTSMSVPLPAVLQETADLQTWDDRIRLTTLKPDGKITITRILKPTEPLLFWRSISLASVAAPSLPK